MDIILVRERETLMIHFAICDEEKASSARLEQLVAQIFSNLKIQCEIDVLFSPEDLEKQLDNGSQYQFIFLNIEYHNSQVNGIELAKFIRNVYDDNQVSIVFTSKNKDYALELFDVQPLNFLIKPLDVGKIREVINKYLTLTGLREKEFGYRKGRNIFRVPFKDIVYVESAGRKLYLHLVGGQEQEFYGSLKTVYESQLQKHDFLFIHASYVVNYDHLLTLNFNCAKLTQDGVILPVSKYRKEKVRALYQEIYAKRMI